MAIEYRGEEILFAVEIDGVDGATLVRPLNQTAGSSNKSADTIDLNTKDKSGSDYGNITHEISIEGIMTEGDPSLEHFDSAMDEKRLVKIHEINTRTLEAKVGDYMISSFEYSFGNSEYVTYSLSASLNGKRTLETLTLVPEGAE
ncbi:phage major tail protein, TP901-1 family [Cytobacillus purgationiresistens]|uniref:TP901-1 family phage major tail protein n=1 Tax=Cytobacillus purgationiresistens TaxID=863449 RepID=A0ABU0AHL4_9BACI|nr:phage major tail protein, TP901-1 family [Cytobacillus purgationiresistens]MDQ0270722.1 TP901-1 family phage major tail protein [Cytobacillus purgationiresistens]